MHLLGSVSCCCCCCFFYLTQEWPCFPGFPLFLCYLVLVFPTSPFLSSSIVRVVPNSLCCSYDRRLVFMFVIINLASVTMSVMRFHHSIVIHASIETCKIQHVGQLCYRQSVSPWLSPLVLKQRQKSVSDFNIINILLNIMLLAWFYLNT